MKRLALLAAVVMLCGCSLGSGQMGEALAVRSRLLSASGCSFRCHLTADYTDTVEQFTLDCQTLTNGTLEFTVVEPESISGITGAVDSDEGALTFDGEVLAFPLMADERLSPISAPWILMNTLKNGYITACVQENELLHLSISDSYADDALELEVWVDGENCPVSAEISWQGRRVVSMTVENFRCS